jgi:hypothetical protein
MREIYDMIEKGIFPEIDQERSEQETFVDHMSLFEKGVWAWMVEAGKKLTVLQKQLEEKKRNFFAIDGELLTDAVYLKATLEAMRPGFWEYIEDRHNIDARKYSVAIRKGYEIVTTPIGKEKTDETSEEAAEASPEGRSIDIIIVRKAPKEDPIDDILLHGKPEGKPC